MHGISLKALYMKYSKEECSNMACSRKTKATSNPRMTKATKRSISKRKDKAWRRYNELKTNFIHVKDQEMKQTERSTRISQCKLIRKNKKSFKGNHKNSYGYARNMKTLKK